MSLLLMFLSWRGLLVAPMMRWRDASSPPTVNDDLVKDCLSVLYNCCICVSVAFRSIVWRCCSLLCCFSHRRVFLCISPKHRWREWQRAWQPETTLCSFSSLWWQTRRPSYRLPLSSKTYLELKRSEFSFSDHQLQHLNLVSVLSFHSFLQKERCALLNMCM